MHDLAGSQGLRSGALVQGLRSQRLFIYITVKNRRKNMWKNYVESVDNYVDNCGKCMWITFLRGSYLRSKRFFVLFFLWACGKLKTLKPLKFQ